MLQRATSSRVRASPIRTFPGEIPFGRLRAGSRLRSEWQPSEGISLVNSEQLRVTDLLHRNRLLPEWQQAASLRSVGQGVGVGSTGAVIVFTSPKPES